MSIFIMTSVLAWYQWIYTWPEIENISFSKPGLFELMILLLIVSSTLIAVLSDRGLLPYFLWPQLDMALAFCLSFMVQLMLP
jgi:hypothetical protein